MHRQSPRNFICFLLAALLVPVWFKQEVIDRVKYYSASVVVTAPLMIASLQISGGSYASLPWHAGVMCHKTFLGKVGPARQVQPQYILGISRKLFMGVWELEHNGKHSLSREKNPLLWEKSGICYTNRQVSSQAFAFNCISLRSIVSQGLRRPFWCDPACLRYTGKTQ